MTTLVGQTAVGNTVSAGFVAYHGYWGGPGTSVTAVDEGGGNLPRAHKLDAVHPNPFNPTTTVRFALPEPGWTRIRIYDLQGRLVRTLLDETRTAGRHTLVWNGRDDRGARVSSGAYLLTMRAGTFAAQRKMTLLK